MRDEFLISKNQEHLIKYLNRLDKDDRKYLETGINAIDIDLMNKLYINSFTDDELDVSKVAPLPIVDRNEDFTELGESIVKKNQYGVVLLAGGNASRLGLDMPKGCLELHIGDTTKSLFELYIDQLKEAYNKYGVYINLYIMTNDESYSEIYNYFKGHNFFDYPEDKLHFFIQDSLPILNKDGKIMLKDEKNLLLGPNGNGNVFKALKQAGLIKHMISNKIKYVLFLTVDNVMNKFVDINMLGNMAYGEYPVATKTITKRDDTDLNWIFCKYNKKPFMLPTAYITHNLTNKKIDKKYVYREKNITYHIVNINEVDKYANLQLPYHRSFKKYSYMNDKGKMVTPKKNNSFKFEQFIFDAFSYSKNMLLYRVKADEFCPIKDEKDIKKVEKLLNNKKEA